MKDKNVIHVMNAPKGWETNLQYAYIGRPGKGLDGYFGNPCELNEFCPICHRRHYTKSSTLKCYEKYLQLRLSRDSSFKQRFSTLKNKILVCFCAWPNCHGRIIQEFLKKPEFNSY